MMEVLKVLTPVILLFMFATNVNGEASGLTDSHKMKLTKHFIDFGTGCLANYSITFDDIKALQAFQMPQGGSAPCFFACILRKADMLDPQGKMSPEAVLRAVNKIFMDDPEERDVAVEIFQKCSYVNELKVTDGTEGCDRAKFVMTCIMDQGREGMKANVMATPASGNTMVK